jgi:hypothetical protein
MINSRSLVALLCAAVLSACGKDAVQTIGAPTTTGADIKFFNFGVSAPGVNFFANDTLKVTATSRTSCTPPTDPTCTTTGLEDTTGTAYGAASSGGFYAALAPGAYTFKGKISATTNKGVAISSAATTLEDGKNYSLYLSGFYNTTAKSVESFIVEDPIPATIDYTFAYVRFVNASSNSSPLTLYAKSTVLGVVIEVPVGAAVSYKGAGAFVQLPAGVWDLSGRVTGSTANAVARTGVSFNGGRVYTVSLLGDYTVTSTTAANRIRLDNTANR